MNGSKKISINQSFEKEDFMILLKISKEKGLSVQQVIRMIIKKHLKKIEK